MKTQLTIAVVVLTLFWGCLLDQQLVKESSAQPADRGKENHARFSDTPAGPYYDYLEAEIHRRRGDTEQAIQWMKQAIEKDPDSAFLKKELVTLYIQQKDNQHALQVVETLIKENPKDVEALILYARLKQTMKKMDDAKRAYEKVISLDPEQENTYLVLGRIYMDEKEYDKAFSVYRRLVEVFPYSYIGHFFLGKIHTERKEYDAAEKAFRTTLDLQPDLEEPRNELIEIYKIKGLTQKVVETYADILQENPDDVGVRLEFGYFQHTLGNVEAAEALLKPLGAESSGDPKIIQKLIQLYLNPKNYSESLTILNYMLAGSPESSDLNYLAGVASNGLEDDDKEFP